MTIHQQSQASRERFAVASMVSVVFTDRQGRNYVRTFATAAAARERLAVLDADESRTMQLAPTDSGDVRFAYNAEAKAIRAALAV
jgi:hypothetical protein